MLAYHLTGERGPDHAKVFAMEVLPQRPAHWSRPGATARREAEQAAAKAAVLAWEKETP